MHPSGSYLSSTIVTPFSPSPKTPNRKLLTYLLCLRCSCTAFLRVPVPLPCIIEMSSIPLSTALSIYLSTSISASSVFIPRRSISEEAVLSARDGKPLTLRVPLCAAPFTVADGDSISRSSESLTLVFTIPAITVTVPLGRGGSITVALFPIFMSSTVSPALSSRGKLTTLFCLSTGSAMLSASVRPFLAASLARLIRSCSVISPDLRSCPGALNDIPCLIPRFIHNTALFGIKGSLCI